MKRKVLGINIILILVAMLVLLTGCGEQKENVLESEKDSKNESKEVKTRTEAFEILLNMHDVLEMSVVIFIEKIFFINNNFEFKEGLYHEKTNKK